jgi:lipopolysaccharide biosynthesis glycosyltransferase
MSDKPPITVACAANEAYAIPLAVMLTSIVCHLKTDRDLDLYIIESDISVPVREKIEASVRQNKKGPSRLGLHWLKLDKARIAELPVAGQVAHITSESYARLLAPDLLPPACRRAVYLDCDLVVLADLAGLYDAMDDRHTIAAVANVFYPYVSSPVPESSEPVVFDYRELGIPADTRYFQAGVLVMNLDLWREQNVTLRTIQYLEANKEKVLYHDQSALNAILHDQWLRLDQRWNQTTTALYPEHWKPPAYSREEWLRTKNDPFIVHYSGPDKPWHPGFRRPRSSFFHRYLRKTLFKDDLKISALENVVGYRNYYELWRAKNKLHALLFERGS